MWKILALLMCVQVCAHDPNSLGIVNGTDVPEKKYPWMVSLHNLTYHFCGGSLISEQWVLSAAHCFVRPGYSMDEKNIRVYLGKMTQSEKNPNEVMKLVQKVYTHTQYNSNTQDNDIALLHLDSPVQFNDYMKPVGLVAQDSDFPPGTPSQIIGWGRISEEERLPYPGRLQEATVSVVDNDLCQNKLSITNNMICAGVPSGGVDTCTGDSGGPIMSQYCSEWVQFGITSWGIGCGTPNLPGVYTRVSQYQQWITDTITNHPSQDLPQFIKLNSPCPSSTPGKKTEMVLLL